MGIQLGLIVLDWDETFTRRDTMEVLARCTNDPSRWPSFVAAYTDDLAAHERAFCERVTMEDEVRYLASLDVVERRSVDRIERAGVFRGVRLEDLQRRAKEEIELRDGFHDFCERTKEVTKEILSVNWSSQMIRAALPDTCMIKVTANEICFDADGGAAGGRVTKNMEGAIRTASDKVRVLNERMKSIHDRNQLVAYFGDSTTDLPCLLGADLGVIIGDNQSLRETCKKYNIRVISIHQLDTRNYVKQELCLYRAGHWSEVIL